MKQKLKLGLIIENKFVEAWAFHLVKYLLKKDYVVLEFLILAKSEKNNEINNKESNLLSSYIYWEEQKYKSKKNVFKRKDLSLIITDFCPQNIEELKKNKKIFDIIINLTFRAVKKFFIENAKIGVWGINFGADSNEKKRLKFFWEVFYKKTTSEISLISYDSKNPEGQIIYRTTSNTKNLSFFENRIKNYFKPTFLFLRRLEQVHKFGDGILKKSDFDPVKNSNHNYYPNNLQMLILHLKLFFREVNFLYRRQFFVQEWEILVKHKNFFTKIKPQQGSWYADPFPIQVNNRTYLFFEDFIKSQNKGCISCVEINNGKISEPIEVLNENFHLSYPDVFKFNNEYYMIPESMEDESIRLYKASKFPNEWKLVKKLINNVKAVDSTIFYYEDKHWLFTNIAEDGFSDWEELYLFYSENLFGDWTPHPLNPIVSDVKSSRPAGKIFINDFGEIIRPSQDCSKCYGYAINLNIISKITTTEYEEKVLDKILPKKFGNYFGTHTFNKGEGFYFYDAKKWKRNKNYNMIKFLKNIIGIYHHKPIRNFLFGAINKKMKVKL